jgi:DNA-binding NtrC family response regulator
LRERTEDIESLVKFFCEKYFKETGRKKSFLMSTIRKMQKYPWPGNVRELENTVEKILVHSTSDTIAIHDLPREFFSESSQNDFLTYKAFKKRQNAEEKSFILNSLRIWGSESKTAKEIGIPRSNLRRIVEKNKIRKFVR